MDPQESITNAPTPTENLVVDETSKSTKNVSPTKDTNTITVVSMAIFVLLSLGAVAFLYYQNQQLKSMLASYQTSLPTPSSTPTANSSQIDYFNTFSITLSEDWHREVMSKNPIQLLNYTSKENFPDPDFDPVRDNGKLKIEVYIDENNKTVDEIVSEIENGSETQVVKKDIKVGCEKAKLIESEDRFGKVSYVIVNNPFSNKVYSLVFGLDFDSYKTLRDQILSTFKFSEVPTASPTATSKPSTTPISY